MHLKVLRKAYPKQFQFYPITWVLPAEAGEFKEYYRKVIHKKIHFLINIKPQNITQQTCKRSIIIYFSQWENCILIFKKYFYELLCT